MIKRNHLTKIVATISDLRCDEETIRSLWQAGMSVVRLNTAHQTEAETAKVIKSVRSVSQDIAIMLDTKGPEVRTAGIPGESAIKVVEGDSVFVLASLDALSLFKQANPDAKAFSTNYIGFADEVAVGSRVLIDDGLLGLHVVSAEKSVMELKVENNGVIKNRKSINTPDVKLKLPSVTDRDKSYLKFAAENGIDFVAHSFVRCKQDVFDVKAELDKWGSKAAIISKIENREGVDNIDEIIEVSFGIMVARGDLGIEVPMEEVPLIQKMLIRKCVERSRPVICATQMLHSMIVCFSFSLLFNLFFFSLFFKNL